MRWLLYFPPARPGDFGSTAEAWHRMSVPGQRRHEECSSQAGQIDPARVCHWSSGAVPPGNCCLSGVTMALVGLLRRQGVPGRVRSAASTWICPNAPCPEHQRVMAGVALRRTAHGRTGHNRTAHQACAHHDVHRQIRSAQGPRTPCRTRRAASGSPAPRRSGRSQARVLTARPGTRPGGRFREPPAFEQPMDSAYRP